MEGKNIINKKYRGFTLVEIIVTLITSSIIIMAASSIYYFHATRMKKLKEKTEKALSCQYALEFMVKNIHNSSWIVIRNNTSIELHSHSNPKIRTFRFEDNKLVFRTDSEENTLVEGVDSDRFFSPIEQIQILPGNRYKAVEIKFWTKDDSYSDVDTTYIHLRCFSKEKYLWGSSGVIYVDPANAKVTEDGTKEYPFSDLNSAFEVSSPMDLILVLSGNHEITDEDESHITNMYIYVAKKADLRIKRNLTIIEQGSIVYIQ